jgi:hypothetical protein
MHFIINQAIAQLAAMNPSLAEFIQMVQEACQTPEVISVYTLK